MEKELTLITPHPMLKETLFAGKTVAMNVFLDVLGLHEINHIAINRVNADGTLLCFSSTPSLDFNLFSSNLWQHDQSYSASWVKQLKSEFWTRLYNPERYDELYHTKQIRHGFALGLSMVAKFGDEHYIFSIASRASCDKTQNTFTTERESLYKIGQYCTNLLRPYFLELEDIHAPIWQGQYKHETSN